MKKKALELGTMVLCLQTNHVHVIIEEHVIGIGTPDKGYIGVPIFLEADKQRRTWFFPSQEGTKWKRCSA
jgi:hypothetical protein